MRVPVLGRPGMVEQSAAFPEWHFWNFLVMQRTAVKGRGHSFTSLAPQELSGFVEDSHGSGGDV